MTVWNRWKSYIIRNAIFLFLALLIAFGLKYHYSRAGSEGLAWILAPTAELVEQVSGIQFVQERHTGFVTRNRRFVIAPSCAGVNFMLMAFCMAMFSGINSFSNSKARFAWLAASLVGAYFLTIAVNAARIMISMVLYDADIYTTWITPQRVHRLGGTLIYFFALRVFYIIITWLLPHAVNGSADIRKTGIRSCGANNNWRRWMGAGLIPLFWYSLIALIIPFLNTAGRPNQTILAEHSWMVISGCMIVLILPLLIQSGYRRVRDFRQRLKSGRNKT